MRIKEIINSFVRDFLRDVFKEEIEDSLRDMVEMRFRDMDVIKIFDESIIKIQPTVEESMKLFLLEKIRDGKYPSGNKDYWSCLFCGHIAPKNDDVKYCSGCGAKW